MLAHTGLAHVSHRPSQDMLNVRTGACLYPAAAYPSAEG